MGNIVNIDDWWQLPIYVYTIMYYYNIGNGHQLSIAMLNFQKDPNGMSAKILMNFMPNTGKKKQHKSWRVLNPGFGLEHTVADSNPMAFPHPALQCPALQQRDMARWCHVTWSFEKPYRHLCSVSTRFHNMFHQQQMWLRQNSCMDRPAVIHMDQSGLPVFCYGSGVWIGP